jgi:glyoxylase-like metal-dependent hydrolase (beta-lactamase superfamily II)/8-oxo-dGTP pyrophosphatase MutT (NUDIX family)
LRDGPDGLETLLTRRPTTMAFAAGVHVFPGGAVDAADTDPRLAARSVRSPEEASVALGVDLDPTVALAAHMAAIRELFEEAGILLADAGPGTSEDTIRGARTALVGGETTLPDVAEALDLRLRTDLLVPLSRWVTPAGFARRFDTRFFATMLPPGREPTFEGGEVVDHVWSRPLDALEAMADGRIVLWLPTSSTLQQLAWVHTLDEIRQHLAPGRLDPVVVEAVDPTVTRIVMPAGGGVAGQPVCAYLVGREHFVLFDPGDPTGAALETALELVSAAGGRLELIALTHADPDHAGGAENLVVRLGTPVVAGPGAGRSLPYEVRELDDLDVAHGTDVAIRAVRTPGPRPEHLAYILGDARFVVTGDLDGVRGARMLPGPTDDVAWAASRERLARLAPNAMQLHGHPRSGHGASR